MDKKTKILVIYNDPIKRISVSDLIFCFKGYPGALVYYYSIQRGKIPNYLLNIDFDLIIFQVDFIFLRWDGLKKFKEEIYPLIDKLKTYNAIKILLPQDEFIHTDCLNEFINDFNINIVYSVAPESEFRIIYNKVNFNKVKFFKILTGYVSSKTLKKIQKLEKVVRERTIDIGYRATAAFWLGKIGHLKGKIGEVFNLNAPSFNLITNISTKTTDTFYGDSWYKFLLGCKYVIGVESGASLHDPDGNILKKCIAHKKAHPDATFEECEEACFPGVDGNLNFFALSPRHLESAMTKSCQVLIEGKYSGVLQPGLHYIELKKDFSNLNEVLQIMKDDKLRETITSKAYSDLVTSGKYTYKKFVNYIITNSLQGKTMKGAGLYAFTIFVLNRIREWYITKKMWISKEAKNKEVFRRAKYYIKSIPYTILIKLGITSLIKKREAIRY